MTELLSRIRLSNRYLQLAWLAFGLSIPLRLYFYGGFGLGDDVNDVHLARRVLDLGGLDPSMALHYRVLPVVTRALSFAALGVTDFSFILPIFLFALAVHALSIAACADILGARAAFVLSLLFLLTPFETLCGTANSPDAINGFFAVGCGWQVYRGLRDGSRRAMVLGALLLAGGVLGKVSGLGVAAVVAAVTVCTLRKFKLWIAFWSALAAFIGMVCLADFFYSGSFFRWYFFNNFFHGDDVTDRIGEVLAVFPRYILHRDDFGNWMFGLSGWLAALGFTAALYRLKNKETRPAAGFIAASLLLVLLVEFMPHRLTLTGYYSHWRVFRYLSFIAPALYFAGAYAVDRALSARAAVGRFVLICFAAVLTFNASQIPAVTFPLRDPNAEGRAMIAALQRQDLRQGMTISADHWKCMRISAFIAPERLGIELKCMGAVEADKQREDLRQAASGLLVTGGASMAWYGNPDFLHNIDELGFVPPKHWQELYRREAAVTAWRREPLVLWKVSPDKKDEKAAASN